MHAISFFDQDEPALRREVAELSVRIALLFMEETPGPSIWNPDQ